MDKQPDFSKELKLEDIQDVCFYCPAMQFIQIHEDYDSFCFLYRDDKDCEFMDLEYTQETFDIIEKDYEKYAIQEEESFKKFHNL